MRQSVLPSTEEKERQLRAAEEKQRAVNRAIEAALAIGDLSKTVENPVGAREFIRITAERINDIVAFDTSGIYFVDQQSSDIELFWCSSEKLLAGLDQQMEYLVGQGHVAWALREPRGIMVYSKDHRYRVLLHAIATYSRIRGIFIGLFPLRARRWPHGAHQAVSLILRNAASALESVEFFDLFKRQNAEMITKVDKKVDELRRHDLQLENARKMDAIATLAGGVAHQYNNALLVLTGNLELIKMSQSGTPEFDKFVDRIETTAQRMQDLTSKLLAYARGGKYVTQPISIQTLIKEVLAKFKPTVDSGIKLDLRLPVEPYLVYVDSTQMLLALSAVVTNATEAVEKDGLIRISVEKVTLPAAQPSVEVDLPSGDYVAVHVSDNGHGMPESIKNRIFEPFFTTKFTGRGLSMAAVFGIVQNHHGAIAVESKVEQGTTVHLYLPVAEAPR